VGKAENSARGRNNEFLDRGFHPTAEGGRGTPSLPTWALAFGAARLATIRQPTTMNRFASGARLLDTSHQNVMSLKKNLCSCWAMVSLAKVSLT
jgi:hypothetical protein